MITVLDFGYYNMDCMEGMSQFPDNYFDLAIVDPPYGIKSTGWHKIGKTNTGKMRGDTKSALAKSKVYHLFDDSKSPDKKYFDELFRISKNQVIWGGNFFGDYLGRASCMIVWDKGRRNMDQADCEIAWTSFKTQSRVFNFRWNGFLQEDMKNKEKRIHPTQKPVKLYEYILKKYTKEGEKILDTHVGSASSLIACENLNRQYVGFELDQHYYNTSYERLINERKGKHT